MGQTRDAKTRLIGNRQVRLPVYHAAFLAQKSCGGFCVQHAADGRRSGVVTAQRAKTAM
jgi:hypothetical protein